ncbi:hypothetical protein AAFF_G00292920 [Aldrovandia affinis]|uniref:Uncharacterized protein n=1 Tax=Aldrovandia affinis TaxID=143900 RepID=A0AAD7SSJ3_9TELE|nr:hypothetical protein AAFF_G00292920 [Aldrovandia affinis]
MYCASLILHLHVCGNLSFSFICLYLVLEMTTFTLEIYSKSHSDCLCLCILTSVHSPQLLYLSLSGFQPGFHGCQFPQHSVDVSLAAWFPWLPVPSTWCGCQAGRRFESVLLQRGPVV